MYLLAVDTTGPAGSCALLDTETSRVMMKSTAEPMAHLRMLAYLMDELLSEAGAAPSDIACVAASSGPGSYTGIRIGVTTARTVAQALNIPCVKAPTLELFRVKAKNRPASVILNARRGQVYGAVYDKGGATVLSPGPYMLDDVVRAGEEAGLSPVFFGDGVDAYSDDPKWGGPLREAFSHGAEAAPVPARYQTASMAAEYALPLYKRGDVVSPAELLPDYMRKTEAEQKLEDGSLKSSWEEKMKRFAGTGIQ